MTIKAFFTPPSSRAPLFVTACKASLLTVLCLCIGLWFQQLIPMSAVSMGISAAALSDHPSQYPQRLNVFVALLLCFGLAAISVVVLVPYPWLLIVCFCAATFLLLMAGGFGPRFGKISFGALAIAIFTLLSYPHQAHVGQLPFLLLSGSVSYFLVSTLVQRLLPNVDLEHDNQQLFATLAKYQLAKARFFDEGSDPIEVRLNLARQGAQATKILADMRSQLILRQQQRQDANHQSGYLEQFFKAQVLLERLSSSHLLYPQLKLELADTSLTERIQRVMVGLSKRILRQPRYRRFSHYVLDDQVEAELTALKSSTQRLAERHVFSAQCASQLSFLLENLEKIKELTETHTPFPNANFLFSEPLELGWRHYWQLLKTPKSPLFRHAIRLSFCMLVGYLILQTLPASGQNYWLLLTILFITKPTFSETKQRLLQRVTGTVLGVGVATGLYWLGLPTLLLVLIAGITKFTFFWYLEHRYSIAVACISIYVAIILQFYGLDAEAVFMKRILLTTLAAGLVYVALRYLWPDWLQKRSKQVLADSLATIKQYQSAVFAQYLQQQRLEDEPYRLARFQAHLSEANLVEHWQALLAEPRSKKSEASTLYLLTGRLHAYLSHLSALAAHRGQVHSMQALPLIEQIGQTLSQQLHELNQALISKEPHQVTTSYQWISMQLSQLVTQLKGDDLLVAFQLLRLNEDLEQIRQLIYKTPTGLLKAPT